MKMFFRLVKPSAQKNSMLFKQKSLFFFKFKELSKFIYL
jgi:hypothetical protein